MKGEPNAGDECTCLSLLHLLGHDSKHSQSFGHDLSHHVRHLQGQWDFGVGLEAYKEVFYLVKEFDKHVMARRCVPRCLCEAVLSWPTQ